MSKGVYRFFLNWSEGESPVEEIMKEEKRKRMSWEELSDLEFVDEWLREYKETKEREYKHTGSYYNHPATRAAESIDN